VTVSRTMLVGLALVLLTTVASASPLGPKARFAADPVLGAGPARGERALPAFHEIEHVPERKREFFAYLGPLVHQENERILADRRRLLEVRRAWAVRGLTAADRAFVNRLAKEYRLSQGRSYRVMLDDLVKRVDVIPRSLVLAQAAKESGWGSSRFARNANNLFGQWCFESGCGVVPLGRPSSASHEVRRFPTVRASVRSYLRNLNSHPSYEPLRDVRATMRARGQALCGVTLAAGLERYSERGRAYVYEVQSLIVQNDLEAAWTGSLPPPVDIAANAP
jgi:Bax protein